VCAVIHAAAAAAGSAENGPTQVVLPELRHRRLLPLIRLDGHHLPVVAHGHHTVTAGVSEELLVLGILRRPPLRSQGADEDDGLFQMMEDLHGGVFVRNVVAAVDSWQRAEGLQRHGAELSIREAAEDHRGLQHGRVDPEEQAEQGLFQHEAP